jgi:LacI family transcriptional regulator
MDMSSGKQTKTPGASIRTRRNSKGIRLRTQPPKVALLVETSNAYARGLLGGIISFIRSDGPWNIYLAEHGRGERPPQWLSEWDGDGIIARVENEVISRILGNMRIPIVNLSSRPLLSNAPLVTTDNEAIARLAFQHFAERGFRRFAFCGDDRFVWSTQRGSHFDRLVHDAGFECAHYSREECHRDRSDAETDAIARWLAALPRPVAVFCCYDARGQQVLDACRRQDIAVPEEVAVLGVDNDDVLCNLAPVPMSSVIPNSMRAGFKAAELLNRMLSNEKVSAEMHFIPPLGVATRQSTDVTAATDPHVAKAARFIRENAFAGIDVGDVVAAVPVARRILERRFRATLGRTLREEITRVQMQRVTELLVGTDLSLAEIAERIGFKHVEYLTYVFKRETGQPPSVYRAENQPRRRYNDGVP